jgi:hypothetical protein
MSTRFQIKTSFKSMVTMPLVLPAHLDEEGEKLVVDSAVETPFSSPEVEKAPMGFDATDESGND